MTLVAVLLSSVTLASAQQAPAPASLEQATREYQTSSQNLVAMQEAELQKETEKVAQLRQLVDDGLVARKELADAEQALTTLRDKIAATRRQVTDSEQRIAELHKSEATIVASATRKLVKPTILRYSGASNWSLASLSNLQSFFTSKFGRPLPTSAIGQSATHNRLGFNHSHAVDVALHPDSIEGRALIGYLQSMGIPYLAFRGAVPGVATGAHIHVGAPSHRLG